MRCSCAFFGALFIFCACSLPQVNSGAALCDADGGCVEDFVCNPANNRCYAPTTGVSAASSSGVGAASSTGGALATSSVSITTGAGVNSTGATSAGTAVTGTSNGVTGTTGGESSGTTSTTATTSQGTTGAGSGAGSTATGGSAATSGQACPAISVVNTVVAPIAPVVMAEAEIAENAGDLVVLFVYSGLSPNGPPDGGPNQGATTGPALQLSVFDTQNDTFYAGPMYEDPNDNQSAGQLFYAPNVLGGLTVLAAQVDNYSPDAGPSIGFQLVELGGMATVDVADIASGSAWSPPLTPLSPGPLTTVSPCDVVVAGAVDGHDPYSFINVGSGFSMLSSDAAFNQVAAFNAGLAYSGPGLGLPAGSTVNPTFALTLDASPEGWVAAQMAFLQTGSVPPAQPTTLAITTAPLDASADTCAGPVTIESEDSSSTPTLSSTGISLDLSGGLLSYYFDSACVTQMDAGTAAIFAGTDSATFYVEGVTSTTLSVSATGFSTAAQSETFH